MSSRRTSRVVIDGSNLDITLSWRDKIAALVGDQAVPLSAISSVAVVSEPFRNISGIRSPGLAVPWVTKVGVWRRPGHRTLVVVRRGEQAIRIEADGQRFDAYLIGSDDPNTLVDKIHAATGRT